jgi:hypothetical protein
MLLDTFDAESPTVCEYLADCFASSLSFFAFRCRKDANQL